MASEPSPAPTPVRPPRRARLAVATIFFVNGTVLASWVPHIPALKARHGLGDGGLGVVLVAMAVGAVLALPPAGWLVARLGSRVVTAVAAVALCLGLPLPILSPSAALAFLALGALGAANATLDVAMNAHAVTVQAGYGRPIMSSFHGLFSLGGVAGAGGASAAMGLGLGDARHVALATVSALCVVGAVLPGLGPPARAPGPRGPVFARPPRALLVLGLLTFGGLLAEGAMADWSTVYLRDALGTTEALAATGFAAFSLTMAVGRLGGDRLVGLFGPARVMRATATLAAVGLGGALVLGRPVAAIVGFGLVGLGISNVIPVLFSAAGRVPGVPAGSALAAVATTGYSGFLAGPPLIGLVAELTSLSVGLGIVGAACLLLAVGASGLPRSDPAPGSLSA